MIREIFIRKVSDGEMIFHAAFTETKDIAVEALEKAFFEASRGLKEGEIEHTEIVRYAFSYMHTSGYYFAILLIELSLNPSVWKA